MYLQFNYQRPGDNANNGNVHHVYDLLNGNNRQAFTYDKMNRMNAFSGQVNGIVQSRAYALDRYGNLSDSYNPLSFNTVNNRITATGYGYDYAGNLTTEPQRAYSYDGENRLRLAVVGGITVGQYLYDGEGRRAKRITPQETTEVSINSSGQETGGGIGETFYDIQIVMENCLSPDMYRFPLCCTIGKSERRTHEC